MNPFVLGVDSAVAAIVDHLWQSTLVAVAAVALSTLLRRYRAQVRYTIAAAASLKFLIPFALLAAIGGSLPWPPARLVPVMATDSPAAAAAGPDSAVMPSTAMAMARPEPEVIAAATPRAWLPLALALVWAAGSLVVFGRRALTLQQVVAARRDAQALDTGRVADAFARGVHTHLGGARVVLRRSARCSAPCVAGLIRPVLLWPEGVDDRLTDAQLDAIVAHELAHVRRRDNLAAAAQAVVEILFWFHPLVWWVGARLTDERERACDEAVLRSGAAPEVYADGILKVCECSLGVPALGAAGISGSILTQRIEAIMTTHTPRSLGRVRRALLAAAAAGLIAGPVAAGAMAKTVPQNVAGGITGVVTDQMGGHMAGVSVTARAGSNVPRTATTDASGRYLIAGLPADEYDVRFAQAGFKSHAAKGVRVAGGADAVVHAQLSVGGVTQEVTLRASASEAQRADPAAAPAEEARLLQAIAQAPADAAGHLALAQFYYRHERLDESAAAMRRAAEIIGQRASAQRSDDVVRLPSGGEIKEPRKIRDVKPIYPAIARAARVGGVVILEARIAEDGTVRDARVLRSVPLLDAAALGAVRQWLFTPTLLNGVPVEVLMTVTVSFSAEEGLR